MTTKTKRIITILLRLLALGATIAAIVVMVTSHESAQVLNLTFTAKYSNDPVFKYFVVAEAIAGGYSLLVLVLSSKSLLWRLTIILDVVVTALLTSSISAALAIAHVGKKGNSHAGWLPICEQVPKFCDRVTGALVAGFAAAIIYSVLLLYSLHAVLSPIFAVKI
ncbi:CASP-like protein 1C3 [Pistacia vera]|uniref:CASP-like protein 1C3 n=1 Tax=Pistacia vera TaxID=55513 RepID=UPI001263309F|nr:CASP-like protein 1C3 [Pistacia vera]